MNVTSRASHSSKPPARRNRTKGKAQNSIMTLKDENDLLNLVPIGEENAVSARLIWQQLGLWSPASIKGRLNILAAAGRVHRKKSGDTSVYFRRINQQQ